MAYFREKKSSGQIVSDTISSKYIYILNKLMILCRAPFIAVLGRGLDSPALAHTSQCDIFTSINHYTIVDNGQIKEYFKFIHLTLNKNYYS